MAAHDPTFIKDGNNINANQLIVELRDKLPCVPFGKKWANAEGNGVINTASATYSLMRAVSVVCEPDDVIFFRCYANVSVDTLGLGASIRLRVNGTTFHVYSDVVDGASTSNLGIQKNVSAEWVFVNLSGTIDFELYWARFITTGTIYSADQYLVGQKFKRSTYAIDGQ